MTVSAHMNTTGGGLGSRQASSNDSMRQAIEGGRPVGGQQMLVLHVEDDQRFRELTATYLTEVDPQLTVEPVSSPATAVERIQTGEIDCVVSDYEMPEQDGLELLRRVRSEAPQLPFILFTGRGNESVASEAISAGVTDYLQKEADGEQFELLANRIRNAVERVRVEQRADRTQRRHAALVEHSVDAVAELTFGDGVRIRDTNGVFRNWFEATPRASIARRIGEVVDGSPRELSDSRVSGTVQLDTGEGQRSYLLRVIGVEQPGTEPVQTGFAVFTDITERQRYQTRLRELQRRLPELMTTTTREETASVAISIAEDVLGAEMSACSLETEPGALTPVAVADRVETVFSPVPTYRRDEDSVKSQIVWDVFQSGDPEITDDVRQDDRVSDQTPTETAVIRPLGDHGVFVISSLEPNAFTETDKQLSKILCTTLIAAFDRVEREQRLRDQQVELRQERDRSRTLFENLDQPAVEFEYTDSEPVVQAVNPAFEACFGRSAKEIRGESLDAQIVPASEAENAAELNQRVSDGETVDGIEVQRLAADGERTFLLQTASYTDAPGGFAIYADITERDDRESRLQRQRNRLETLYETIPHPAVHVVYEDGEPYIQTTNRAFREQFGYDREAGEPINDLIVPNARRPAAEAIDREATEDDTVEREVQRLTTDGCREFLFRGRLLDTDRSRREGVAVYIDVTERNRRKRQLERQNDRLDGFTSIVSHDLRNPLNVAQGQVELARMQEDLGRLEMVDDALDRMERLIEDLLTLAREGEEIGECQSVQLRELCERCWDGVETRSATLRVESSVTVSADPLRLRQVFENLFRNAVEHGGSGVTVRVGTTDEGFYVADDGGGIPPDQRQAVFQGGVSTGGDGAGLGLSIVDQVVTAHGWSIHATDSATGGARFEVTGVAVE